MARALTPCTRPWATAGRDSELPRPSHLGDPGRQGQTGDATPTGPGEGGAAGAAVRPAAGLCATAGARPPRSEPSLGPGGGCREVPGPTALATPMQSRAVLCALGREELSCPAWTAVGPAEAGPSHVGRVDTMPVASLPVVLSGSFFLHTPHSHVSVWTEQLSRREEGPGCKRGWTRPEPPLPLGSLILCMFPRVLTRWSIFPGQ